MQPHLNISSLDADRIGVLAGIGPTLLAQLARADIRAPADMPPDIVTMNPPSASALTARARRIARLWPIRKTWPRCRTPFPS